LQVAQIDEPEIEVDDFVEDDIEAVEFGRISAQAAKQVIIHKVREAERKKVADALTNNCGPRTSVRTSFKYPQIRSPTRTDSLGIICSRGI
jgi:hypothetical protein